jgi:hypothetical protein
MNVLRNHPRWSAIVAALMYAALLAEANASGVAGWWGGTWTCKIDGRPAQMKWVPVSVVEGDCEGDTCSQSSSAAWKGSFFDGSQWVALNNPRPGSKGGLYFNHADGNKWYLPEPKQTRVGMRSEGWTTWQGNRYKLICWH